MAQIEVEYIGEISEERFSELRELFEKKGKFKKEKKRLSFMYFRDSIPKDIGEIKDEPVDLRFRVTNKQPEIILKYGIFDASHARKEISIEFSSEESERYIEFLKCLGWHLGVIYATHTLTYEYNGIEFALAEIKGYGYNFEAEILTDDSNVVEAKKKIEQELKVLGIKPFDEQGLNKQCNVVNNKKELQFDFNKTSFEEIKERFKEFFD